MSTFMGYQRINELVGCYMQGDKCPKDNHVDQFGEHDEKWNQPMGTDCNIFEGK
jgi:hypothetical protein